MNDVANYVTAWLRRQEEIALAQEPAIQAGSGGQMPAGMRALLLGVLAIAYPAGAPQTRLGNASDGAIAWQVQSCLDDWADHSELAQ